MRVSLGRLRLVELVFWRGENSFVKYPFKVCIFGFSEHTLKIMTVPIMENSTNSGHQTVPYCILIRSTGLLVVFECFPNL